MRVTSGIENLAEKTSNPTTPPVVEVFVDLQSQAQRLQACVAGWIVGTISCSVLFGIDILFSLEMPGRLMGVTILISLLLTFAFSFAAPIHIGKRVLAFFASVALMIVQFVILGIISFAIYGMEGMQ
jgi:hypothetical protein